MPPASRTFYDLGIIHPEGNITSGDAHIAVHYERMLAEGLAGYRARTESLLSGLDLTVPADMKKSYFYRSVLITLDAVVAFAHRYAALAADLASTEPDVDRAAELTEMSRILTKVPEQPAETFHEAVQAVWLVQLCLQIESNGHSLSYGRFDQFMSRFYDADLEAGRITAERATELLTNLWLKTMTIAKIRSWSHTRFSAGGPLYQNVTVGGQTPDGRDAVNPLLVPRPALRRPDQAAAAEPDGPLPPRAVRRVHGRGHRGHAARLRHAGVQLRRDHHPVADQQGREPRRTRTTTPRSAASRSRCRASGATAVRG